MADLVDLKGGLVLPRAVLELALRLEDRGVTLHQAGEKLRAVAMTGPLELADEDKAAITRWKPHLLALVDYCAVPLDIE